MNWMPAISKANLRELALLWALAYLVLLWSQWRSKRAAGLPLAYAFGLSMTHLVGAFAYCFDYYVPISPILVQGGASLNNTFQGFWVASIGMLSFVLGCLIAPVFLPTPREPTPLRHPPVQITTKLPGTFMLIGFLFFFFGPLLRRIPSFSSFTSGGTYLTVVSVTLFSYFAYQQKKAANLLKWMIATAGFPFMTMIFQGFAGFGISAACTTWQLMLRFVRPRLISIILLLALNYAGLSFYVNYMRERDSLRDSVWGEKSFGTRLTRLSKMFTEFDLFDPYKQHHLEMIDMRLNQNDLVGKAVIQIASGRVELAHGGTLIAVAVSLVPRILWPGKPATGGSGSIVSLYTGVKFAEGTSVGVGQVMEFFINWGMSSVIIGFLIYGLLIRWIDMHAAAYLNAGDYWHCTCWLLPGFAMIQPGGVLTEVVGGMAGNIVFVWALHKLIFERYYLDPQTHFPAAPARSSRSRS